MSEPHLPHRPAPGFWDRLGLTMSGICIVHCLLLPVVLATLPLWPFGEALHRWLHPVFALLLVPTTLLAMRAAQREHGDRRVLGRLALGLAVILPAGAIGHAVPGAALETVITLVGSLLLIAGHWRNWRLCRSCAVPLSTTDLRPLHATAELHVRRRHREPA